VARLLFANCHVDCVTLTPSFPTWPSEQRLESFGRQTVTPQLVIARAIQLKHRARLAASRLSHEIENSTPKLMPECEPPASLSAGILMSATVEANTVRRPPKRIVISTLPQRLLRGNFSANTVTT
jgi:hypothetical protein